MVKNEILIRIRAEVKNFTAGLKSAQKQTETFSKKTEAIGIASKKLNKTLAGTAKATTKIGRTIGLMNAKMGNAQMAFQGWALSLMFFGMLIQRVFLNIAKAALASFKEIAGSNNLQVQGLAKLSAAWEFLKFTIGNALATALLPLVPMIVNVITAIAQWIHNNPAWVNAIIVVGLVVGTLFFVLGVLVLGIMGGVIPALLMLVSGLDAAAVIIGVLTGEILILEGVALLPFVLIGGAILLMIGLLAIFIVMMGGIKPAIEAWKNTFKWILVWLATKWLQGVEFVMKKIFGWINKIIDGWNELFKTKKRHITFDIPAIEGLEAQMAKLDEEAMDIAKNFRTPKQIVSDQLAEMKDFLGLAGGGTGGGGATTGPVLESPTTINIDKVEIRKEDVEGGSEMEALLEELRRIQANMT